eukprot:7383910-Prymnesium_polylepis.1
MQVGCRCAGLITRAAHHTQLQGMHWQLMDVVEAVHQQILLGLGAVDEEGGDLLVYPHPNVGPVVPVLAHVAPSVREAVLDGIRRVRGPRPRVEPKGRHGHVNWQVCILHDGGTGVTPNVVLCVIRLVLKGLDELGGVRHGNRVLVAGGAKSTEVAALINVGARQHQQRHLLLEHL